MLIINKNGNVNEKLKFFIRKFFSLKNYDFVFFYGPCLNIFGQNSSFNIKQITNLNPKNWVPENINDFRKNMILLVNKKMLDSDVSIIKCLNDTEYIKIDLIVICNDDDDIDFISSDFFGWHKIHTIEEHIESDESCLDMILYHLYDN